MDIHLDHDSPVAPYEQVRLQIAEQAQRGELPAGTKLPPVRRLATDIGLAANTVARAYRELEQAGLVETHGRAGTVITAKAGQTPIEAQKAAQRYADLTQNLGLPAQQALELVKAALRLPG